MNYAGFLQGDVKVIIISRLNRPLWEKDWHLDPG